MRRLILVLLAAAAVLGGLALASGAQAGDADTPHYPDLRTLPPSDVKLQRDRQTGTRRIVLSNTVANLGDGRLELRPVNNAATGTTDAYQRIYSHDSAGSWYLQSEELAGTFAFHPAHNHTHFEDFALYELRTVAPGGGIGTLVRSSDKVSFCIIDVGLADGSLEHASSRTYSSCGQSAIQGLSVGWSDMYTWSLPGQSIDITGVGNGTYWLVSTADPADRIDEGGGAGETNNSAAVKVQIKGNSARIVN
jgi:hypothetical protein